MPNGKKQTKGDAGKSFSAAQLRVLVDRWRNWAAENEDEAAVDAIGDCIDDLNALIGDK